MRRLASKNIGLTAVASTAALILSACGGGAVSEKAQTGGGGGSALTKDCANYAATDGITDNSIKLGYSGALGGPFAAVGVGLWGMLGYFDMVNSQGGLEGPDGKKRKVEVVYKDDQYTAATAKANVQEMIDGDKVFALLGLVGTSANIAIRPLVSKNCVPDLFATAGAPELGNPAYPWQINGPVSTYSGEGRLYAEYLKKNMPDAAVAVMSQNDDYGRAEIQSLEAGLQGSNVKVVKEVTFETTDPDLSSQITTLAATKADVFVSIALGAQSLQSINTVSARKDWKPQVISAPLSVGQLKSLNPGAGNKLLTGASVDIEDPKNADLPSVKLYKQWVTPEFQKNGVKLPVSQGTGGWNAADLFAQAVKQAKTLDRASVMEVAHNFTPDTANLIVNPGVKLQTGPDDPYLIEGMVISRWDAGTKTLATVETIDLNGQIKYAPVK